MRLFERGIRRRFPSMVEGDRRRMELMYALMFALPGTPVLFYGEEIGMGDDQSLEGRDAVRTGMQWASEPGGGFSRATRAAMQRPPVEGGPFGYERLNMERQRETPSPSSTGWSVSSGPGVSGRRSARERGVSWRRVMMRCWHWPRIGRAASCDDAQRGRATGGRASDDAWRLGRAPVAAHPGAA